MINWFPGHMNKTLRELKIQSKMADVFVYVLDARCPNSCINPEFIKIIKDKPVVYVLNKADLANSAKTKEYMEKFTDFNEETGEGHSLCVCLDATKSKSTDKIICCVKKLLRKRKLENDKKGVKFIFRAFILGVPNCGKSTIVNNLFGKTTAKVGNKAGVTKSNSWVKLKDLEIMDTPGVMYPKIESEQVGYNLAYVGSLNDEILDLVDVANHLVNDIYSIDKKYITEKYAVEKQDVDFVTLIGKKKGCLMKGGEVDLTRASKLILNDFRTGKIGKITLID